MPRGLAHFSIVLAGLSIAFLPTPAFAQDRQSNDRQSKEWDVTLGMGAAVRPTFEGSDQYIVSPAPFVNVIWRDTVSLGVDGLSAYWSTENFRIGGGPSFGTGRTQNSSIFSQGDSRLTGMGDIPAAFGLKVFADYRIGPSSLPVTVNASLTKFTANGNDGVLVNFGLRLPYKLTPTTTLRAFVSADWADQGYMQTYFGVTAIQSINSGYAQYSPGAGIKDVNFGLGLTEKLNEHWSLIVNGRIAELTGDAANSPIVFSRTQAIFTSAIAYHF